LKAREEILSVGNELDRKQNAQKDYFEKKIVDVHKALRDQIV